MSQVKTFALLTSLVLFVGGTALLAQPDYSECPFELLAEKTKVRVIEKLAIKSPGVAGIQVKFAPSSANHEKFVVRVDFQNEPRAIAASGSYDLEGKRLTLSIDVKDKFRENEIYRLVVQSILAKHPYIESFPINTQETNSISVALGYLHPRWSEEKFRQRVAEIAENHWDATELFEAFEREVAKGLNQQKLIQAFRTRSPAGRLRQELGFNKIEFISVDTTGSEPIFQFEADR